MTGDKLEDDLNQLCEQLSEYNFLFDELKQVKISDWDETTLHTSKKT